MQTSTYQDLMPMLSVIYSESHNKLQCAKCHSAKRRSAECRGIQEDAAPLPRLEITRIRFLLRWSGKSRFSC